MVVSSDSVFGCGLRLLHLLQAMFLCWTWVGLLGFALISAWGGFVGFGG